MFWLKWNSFYFNAMLIMLTITGLTGFIWLKRRRNKIRYRNLFHKLVNQPELTQEAGVKYPPVAQGIEVKSLEEILGPQIELIKLIEMVTETANVFDNRYWPAIERYAMTVHLLPASESDHHCAPGGLLHHGLEVGLYTMQAAEAGLYGMDMETQVRQASRERWLFACFLAGLCHDLGKAASDVRVTTDTGKTWPAQTTRLSEWAEKIGVKKYYVDWEDDRHKVHESFTQVMLSKVLTDGDRNYIGEVDKRLLQEMVMALTPSSGSTAPSMRPYNIRDMVQKADIRSVREDKKQSRTPADLGIETRTPLARHYTEGMQQLFKEGKWQINQSGGGVWVLGPGQDLYLAWPRCGMELYDYLVGQGIQGVPKAPEVIAETLAGRKVVLPAPDGGYYWRIKAGDLDGAPMTVLRLEPQWGRHMAGLLPPGLSGYVESDEGGSLSWSYVEAGNGQDGAPVYSSAQVIPLRQSHEMRVVTPREEIKINDLDGIIEEPVLDNPCPEPGNSMPCTQAPVEAGGWWGILRAVVLNLCLVSMIAIGLLLYMKNQVDPEVSYKLAFWMMMGHAMDTGLFVKILFLGLMGLGIVFYFRRSMQKVKQEEQKAGEIIAEAQEILNIANKDAMNIVAGAGRESGQIKRKAKEDAAEIRINAKEEASAVLELANREATEVIEQAKKKAKETMDDFWLLLQAKARDMGISSQDLQGLVKILQTAKEEAAAIMAQAQVKAQQAAEEIIAQAQEAAEDILEQAQAQAQKESQEVLCKARVQAADILLGQAQVLGPEGEHGKDAQTQDAQHARQEGGKIVAQPQEQGQIIDGQSIQEDPSQDEPFPEEGMDDLERVAALKERIWGILSGQQEMKKRDLERKGHKDRYGSSWELVISNLLASEKIIYDADSNTYRCQNELFQ